MSYPDPVPPTPSRPTEPTQVTHPWVTTARTFVQAVVPAVLVLVVVLPEILTTVVDGMGAHLPEGLRLWLLAAAGFVAALAGVLARIFAIPGVNDALSALKLKAPADAPKHRA